jgi:abequosyltransferase
MTKKITLTVAVPAYGRPKELHTLLESILAQTEPPEALLICEDGSKQREQVRAVYEKYVGRFQAAKIDTVFLENATNLGYDGNVREVINLSSTSHVMLIGNDDALLPNAVALTKAYFAEHQIVALSRSFLRFVNDPSQKLGYSYFHDRDHIFTPENSSAGIAFRVCAFFGGIAFDRQWAVAQNTTRYDGTLFYQVYLFLKAFLYSGIGYIHTPIVAARAGNMPLFGAADSEKGIHQPGKYTPAARGDMWRSVLIIAQDIADEARAPQIYAQVHHELTTRMSFHLFEMFAGGDIAQLKALRTELQKLGLFDHFLPKAFYAINRCLGRFSPWVYVLARKLVQ